mmetsp:Transcript_6528/g.14108  ORF Transcript_6528/g.14108 Transcript_6528/m.14108 type:complete len:129 (+) Transcript_6528:1848-2234(+)
MGLIDLVISKKVHRDDFNNKVPKYDKFPSDNKRYPPSLANKEKSGNNDSLRHELLLALKARNNRNTGTSAGESGPSAEQGNVNFTFIKPKKSGNYSITMIPSLPNQSFCDLMADLKLNHVDFFDFLRI